VSQQLGALQTHTTDTLLFISHTTNALLFKCRCNIFIDVRIIKEMSGSLPSGTPCTLKQTPGSIVLERLNFLGSKINFPDFIEEEGSLSYLHGPATCRYGRPTSCNPFPPTVFI
jgi:hypothetical protein